MTKDNRIIEEMRVFHEYGGMLEMIFLKFNSPPHQKMHFVIMNIETPNKLVAEWCQPGLLGKCPFWPQRESSKQNR